MNALEISRLRSDAQSFLKASFEDRKKTVSELNVALEKIRGNVPQVQLTVPYAKAGEGHFEHLP